MSSLHQALTRIREHADFAALCQWIPYARYLGVQVSVSDGTPTYELPFRKELIGNPVLPALHGGVIAGFMENSAMMHAVFATTETRLPKIIDFSIDYLRSAQAQTCFARCQMIRQGRRVAQTEVRCWQANEAEPIATARANFLLADLSGPISRD